MYIWNASRSRRTKRNKARRAKTKRSAKLRRRFNRTKGRKLGRRLKPSVRS